MNRTIPLWITCLVLAATGAHSDSLYDTGSYESLTSDLTARRVGDMLAVLIFENASAAASAGAETGRSVDIDAEITDKTNFESGTIDFSNDFDGDAAINRAGRLTARVSVTVLEILPNGDLLVSGTQQIRFNQETQSISVSGRVRPEDISPGNTILSTRLADAKIAYTGEGLLGDSEKPGFVSRIFRWIF